MANTIKHVRKREGVYYYERRVPQTVIDKPAAFDAYFGGQKLFRRSLKTKRQAEALLAAREMEETFDKRVAQALGKSSKVSTVASPLRTVTPFMIEQITQQYRDETAKPFRLSATLRERDHEFFSEELERMRSDFEMDAEMIRRVLIDGEPSTDPKLDVADMADVVIRLDGLDAPKGSNARILIQRAIRDGMLAGYRDVTDMFEGRQPWLPSASQRRQPTAPLFGEIVESYVAKLTKRRTIREVRTAYREFEQLIGNLSLDELTKEHFIRYCRNQGSKHVGGKSRGSVARPMSIGNLRKKHGLLFRPHFHELGIPGRFRDALDLSRYSTAFVAPHGLYERSERLLEILLRHGIKDHGDLTYAPVPALRSGHPARRATGAGRGFA